MLTLFRCDNCGELAQEERNPDPDARLLWVKCTACNMARPALKVIEADHALIPRWWRTRAMLL